MAHPGRTAVTVTRLVDVRRRGVSSVATHFKAKNVKALPSGCYQYLQPVTGASRPARSTSVGPTSRYVPRCQSRSVTDHGGKVFRPTACIALAVCLCALSAGSSTLYMWPTAATLSRREGRPFARELGAVARHSSLLALYIEHDGVERSSPGWGKYPHAPPAVAGRGRSPLMATLW